jgi:hypothetical protein
MPSKANGKAGRKCKAIPPITKWLNMSKPLTNKKKEQTGPAIHTQHAQKIRHI